MERESEGASEALERDSVRVLELLGTCAKCAVTYCPTYLA